MFHGLEEDLTEYLPVVTWLYCDCKCCEAILTYLPKSFS